jgi:hypothetical protein
MVEDQWENEEFDDANHERGMELVGERMEWNHEREWKEKQVE